MSSISKCIDTASKFEERDIDDLAAEIRRVQDEMDVDENQAALEAAVRIVERAQAVRSAVLEQTGPIADEKAAETWFSGAPAGLSRLEPGNARDGNLFGPGVYLAKSRDYADTYGRGKDRTIYDVPFNPSTAFDTSAIGSRGDAESLLQRLGADAKAAKAELGARPRVANSTVYEVAAKLLGSKAKVNAALADLGYSGLTFKDRRGEQLAVSFEAVPTSAQAANEPELQQRASTARSSVWYSELERQVAALPMKQGDASDPDIRRSARRQTETPEFKKWFGDSKVIDAEGKPLVVYHGTNADFSKFSGRKLGENTGWNASSEPYAQTSRVGFWFNTNPTAGPKAGYSLDMPVYLSIQNPKRERSLDWLAQGLKSTKGRTYRKQLIEQGYDGIVLQDEEFGGTSYIAFKPEQIKSAIGNLGTFDPADPDIRRSPQRWQADEPSRLDNFLRVMQDKQIDTKRVVAAVKSTVKNIADAWDPYLQETLYHGRTAKQTSDFLDLELRPLLQELQASGYSIDEFETFLHNLHAQERNEQIAKINKALPDGGSGIETADAQAYLAALPAAKRARFDAAAKRVETINRKTQDLLVKSGLEKQSTIDAWNATYKHYVPLQREEFEEDRAGGTGQGFSVRGSASKRAVGSTKEVSNILANVAAARERTIVRAEKNRVATALYGLTIKAPNKDFWFAFAPKRFENTPQLQSELVAMGFAPPDVQNILAEPTQQYVDPKSGLVVTRVNPLLRSSPNVVGLRINGEERFVFFNQRNERAQRMSSALKNLDADQLGQVLSVAAEVSRWFASVNTQYNPVFGIVNGLRDVQSAAFNLSSTPLAGKQADVVLQAGSALRGIFSDLRAHRKGQVPSSKWAGLFEEFQKEGGQTGYKQMFASPKDRADALKKEFKKITEGSAKSLGRAAFGLLSDYNEAIENAVRLSAYKVALDNGMTKQQAASLAKELTVNFNRKGTIALQAGALYAFFNASVQGTARLAETLFEKKPGGGYSLSKAGTKIVVGGLLLGALQALMLAAGGFGDDEPPEFVKEKNLIIPLGDGKYATIPLPLGLHVIPNLGRMPIEWAMSGFRDTPRRLSDLLGMMADTFNPIGSAGISMQTLAPTALDPLAALLENKDFTGKPIAKEDMNPLKPTPGYLRAKDTASWAGKVLSYYINLASGGSKYQPGLVSWTPDQIDYLVGQATGGVGREALKADQFVRSQISGEDLPPNKIPLLGRFYGDSTGQASEASKFYNNLKKVNSVVAEVEGRRKNREFEGLQDYIKEHPEFRLASLVREVDNEMTKLKAQKRLLIEKDADPARVRLVEERITATMRRLNTRAEKLKDQTQ